MGVLGNAELALDETPATSPARNDIDQMDGATTLRELRRIDPDVKVILSSGYNQQDAVQRFASEELAGFIQKPYGQSELLAKIRAVLSA